MRIVVKVVLIVIKYVLNVVQAVIIVIKSVCVFFCFFLKQSKLLLPSNGQSKMQCQKGNLFDRGSCNCCYFGYSGSNDVKMIGSNEVANFKEYSVLYQRMGLKSG